MSKSQDVVERRAPQTTRGDIADRVVLIGARRDARQLIRSLGGEARNLSRIVGFVDSGHSGSTRHRPYSRHVAIHPQADPIPILGRIDHLQSLLDRSGATIVLIAVSKHRAQRHLRPQLASLNRPDVSVRWVSVDPDEGQGKDLGSQANAVSPSSRASFTEPIFDPALSLLSSLPAPATRTQSNFPRWLTKPVDRARWARAAKRLSDVAIASLALVLLSPFLAIIGGLVWTSSGWPIFYTQERVGQGGRLFRMFKFRSMRKDAEQSTGPIWATDQDARCTRIGTWLRKTSVDEFPQLFNVLAGDMSLVGPRPERPVFVDQFRETMPDYDLRHAVPGGMTGWAQVHGWRGRTSLRKRVQYDLDYIQRWSFGLDFRVLLMTVQHVLFNKTNWKGSGRTRRGGSPRDI
jgi:lipopolysaccharide/colanic/teichoic acid biosynthesis glycosyltransferase